ncbi:16S rRNA (cytosine(967)-C(5))-methyltransferase RsmB [Bacillus gobiensis]|uniref:16S rRNA (cytosine(967)-C(5))-methyltransferase RsmB n=1 Tax=Bacillus gobiensis TaxID=1441095 RepID=UPI003D1ED53F
MKKMNVRDVALDALLKLEQNQAYSNLLLQSVIKQKEMINTDRALLTELVYGTLQNQLALDFMLAPFVKKPKKVDQWVRNLLRLSLYQMVYLEKIPDRAVFYEAVEIAKNRGHKGTASFVNGVLRSIQREGVPSFDDIKDQVKRLAIKTSHPEWLVQKWMNSYGYEQTEKICHIHLVPPKQTLRVNQLKTDKETLMQELHEEGYQVAEGDLSPNAIKLEKGTIANSRFFKEGYVTIQDESSMLVARALGVEAGETVLDACAAPGGKSTHMAEMMNNTGHILSLDLHKHKMKLINQAAERLDLDIVETRQMDAREAAMSLAKESFDKILVDAPCSGYGVIRRKPDVKYSKTPDDSERLAEIQASILNSVSGTLKKGGTLVYSTCTMDPTENEQVIHAFLKEHPEFEVDSALKDRLPKKVENYCNDGRIQLLPHYFGTDGFFICSMKRKV